MKNSPSHQKLIGAYYTPAPLADFLARWAIRTPNDLVFEPSLGDGILLAAAAKRLRSLGADPRCVASQLHGVEIMSGEALKAVKRVARFTDGHLPPNIHTGDFFHYAEDSLLEYPLFVGPPVAKAPSDVVIGNPPFIRYQSFPADQRSKALQLMERAGFRPTRLMNSWLPFLVVSSFLLSPSGRLGMVIPAELFQVNYASQVREHLSVYFSRLTIVTFSLLVFPDIQQEVVLLLGEKGGNSAGVRVVEVDDLNALQSIDDRALSEAELKPMDHSSEKWTQYFLTRAEIELLREMRARDDVTVTGSVLDVDVGVVTGQNAFFILSKDQVRTLGLEPHLERIVSRSADLRGAVFTASDWCENVESGCPALLFTPPELEVGAQSAPVQQYIRMGVQRGFHTGYKCRIRRLWYIVPSVWVPDAFMLRQVHSYPKIVLNEARATCTDTIHRVRFAAGVEPRRITSAFMNSMTFAFAEVTGRSYGGGVLTFEPSEAERLPIPLRGAERLDLDQIDAQLRHGDIEAVLDTTDRVLLLEGLGLTEQTSAMLRGIWRKLRDRRINRKQPSRVSPAR